MVDSLLLVPRTVVVVVVAATTDWPIWDDSLDAVAILLRIIMVIMFIFVCL